jgi:hypothetical protein
MSTLTCCTSQASTFPMTSVRKVALRMSRSSPSEDFETLFPEPPASRRNEKRARDRFSEPLMTSRRRPKGSGFPSEISMNFHQNLRILCLVMHFFIFFLRQSRMYKHSCSTATTKKCRNKFDTAPSENLSHPRNF